MTRALLIGDTTPKTMHIASLARQVAREYRWQSIVTGPLQFHIGKQARRHQPRIEVQNRRQLTRIIAAAVDADVIYVAMDDTPNGELLAGDLTDEILSRYPDKAIYRLGLPRLSLDCFRAAFREPRSIDHTIVKAERARRHLNHVFRHYGEKATGMVTGRAIIPALVVLNAQHRPNASRLRIETDTGLRLVSDAVSDETAYRFAEEPPHELDAIAVETRRIEVPPPPCFTLQTLVPTACDVTRASSVEVTSQLDQLYAAGLISLPYRATAIDSDAIRNVIALLVGQTAVGPEIPHYGISPVSIETLPDSVPRIVRDVYRVIWARTLQAHSTTMTAQFETATAIVRGVRFVGESYVPIERGHDAFSFGLFYNRRHVPNHATVVAVTNQRGWPRESELLREFVRLDLGFESPARVLRALYNASYAVLDRNEVALLPDGVTLLEALGRSLPTLLDLELYRNTERQLVAMRTGLDVGDIVERWDAWFREALGVKKERNRRR